MFRVWGLGFAAWGLEFGDRVLGLEVLVSGVGVWSLGLGSDAEI